MIGKNLLLIGSCSLAFTLPIGPVITEGEGSFHFKGDFIEIQTGEFTSIDWVEFSIAENERVRFVQPHGAAVALNRVSSKNPSALLGRLDSNGQCILINPSGILVGKEAVINTGSFIASTLDVHADFLSTKKEFHFSTKTSGSIENYGTIQSENYTALIGLDVLNAGAIQVKNGYGALLAGGSVIIRENCVDPISIQIDDFKASLSHSGTINASDIYVFGGRISLKNGSILDVSKDFDAGRVLVGGDYQGKNNQYQNAEYLMFEKGAQILADSHLEGRGGKIILWSDGLNSAFGLISSKGGSVFGDGGFIEVSGHTLNFLADISTFAPNGNTGTLLLDPLDLTIANAGAGNVLQTGVVPNLTETPTGNVCANIITATPGNSILLNTALATLLASNNVTLQTTGTVGGCNGDILVALGSNVIWNSPFSLTLDAAGDIAILSQIQNSGAGDITLNASGTLVKINDPSLVNPNAVLVGSQNGTTTVNAPNALVAVQGSNVSGNSFGQIGFHNNASNANGPISIVCNSLEVHTFRTHAQIGHGIPESVSTFDCGGDITIVSQGDVSMMNAPVSIAPGGINSCRIGHGGRDVSGGGTTTQTGNIVLQCGGNFLMTGSDISSATLISHGGFAANPGPSTINGNVDILVSGNITLQTNFLGRNDTVAIGHYNIGNSCGDITVRCCGNLTLDTGTPQFPGAIITLGQPWVAAGRTSRGTLSVIAGGNILVNTGNNNIRACLIGQTNGALAAGTHIGDIFIASGGQIAISNRANGTLSTFIGIGASGTNINNNSNTYVVAANGISIQNFANGLAGIMGSLNVNVASGADIEVSSIAGTGFALIGPARYLATPSTTSLFAAGNITFTNATLNSLAVLGRSNVALPATNVSLSVMAKGDITIASGFQTTTGSIFIEADSPFACGELFCPNAVGLTCSCSSSFSALTLNPETTLVGGIPFPTIADPIATCCLGNTCAINPAPIFSCGTSFFPNVPLQANQNGGVIFDSGPSNTSIALQTNNGDITLHSSSTADLFIGTQSGNVQILTTSGNIEIWGSIPGNAFGNITIDTDLTTTGTILVVANANMELTDNAVDVSGTSVTLVVDNAFSIRPFLGSGSFSMAAGANIATLGGPLTIYTSQQGLNSILGQLNGQLFSPGALFTDSTFEHWCTYFDEFLSGNPFTIAYKPCLQLITAEAMIVVDQFLVDLHPFNEFPGWVEKFNMISLDQQGEIKWNDPYWFRRRYLKFFNQPKTWTVIWY